MKMCSNCIKHIRVNENVIYCPPRKGFYVQDNCCKDWEEEIKKTDRSPPKPKEKSKVLSI